MIKVETKPFDFLPPKGISPLIDLLKKKSFHLACPALTGNSVCMHIMESVFGVHEAVHFIEQVNNKMETGCFYPRIALTIYPVLDKGMNAEETMDKIMKDILKANDYLKTDTLHVITEPAGGYDPEAFLTSLNRNLQNPPEVIKWLRTVYFSALS